MGHFKILTSTARVEYVENWNFGTKKSKKYIVYDNYHDYSNKIKRIGMKFRHPEKLTELKIGLPLSIDKNVCPIVIELQK